MSARGRGSGRLCRLDFGHDRLCRTEPSQAGRADDGMLDERQCRRRISRCVLCAAVQFVSAYEADHPAEDPPFLADHDHRSDRGAIDRGTRARQRRCHAARSGGRAPLAPRGGVMNVQRAEHGGRLALEHTKPPHAPLVEPLVRQALAEDFGRAGDITTDAIIPADQWARAVITAREPGVISALIAADLTFKLVDPTIRLAPRAPDGTQVARADSIADIEGPARASLTAERVALNFLRHLSGVATATHQLVAAVAGTQARIICTRKTIPGLRVLEKYAVRCGGGLNHRFGLDDAVLVKDNHIAAAGGIEPAVKALRGRLGPMVKIEVEVDTLDQLDIALRLGIDAMLLDNMAPETMTRAVAMARGRAKLEASGGVTLERVRRIAESGVDYISSGAITHSARSLDLGLDFL